MAPGHLGRWLSLLRQGFELDVDFGTHSVEAMAWIAEVVESSVYARDSLRRTPDGVAFRLANPPLRLGAFGAARLTVWGTLVPPTAWELRTGGAGSWRTAASLSPEAPITLLPGEPIEVQTASGPVSGLVRVRLELESVAIPPPVWLEFDDVVREPLP